MDWAVFVVLHVMFQPSLSVLFTVEAEQTMYKSEFGGDVVMGCRFQPKLLNPHDYLKVTWHWITPTSNREVYQMDNSVENLTTQHLDYRGRVTLLTEELQEGWAKLKVSRIRMNDAGHYQCLVQTVEGADYQKIILSVKAPYKAVTKHIQRTAEMDEVLLTCQSEGYPNSSVMWQDGQLQRINASTTALSTPDQLFKVTSEIRVRLSDKNNYTCSFTNDGYSATFHIPDEMPIPHVKNNAFIIALAIGLIMMVVIVAAVLTHCRRKGLQVNQENEEEKNIFNRGCMEENLGALVKAHYCDFSFSADARRHLDAFGVEELPQRLQNSERQPVNLQALLPKAGGTLLLEGPPGSGKTTLAHILVSSWTEGPTHALSKVHNLSTIRVLLYIDCSKVKGALFQEITTQLSLKEKITENELRTMLTRSSGVLLLLDGYREANQLFDESLKKFLSLRGGCRVLTMACSGHCPTLKDIVGTEGVLELQTENVMY